MAMYLTVKREGKWQVLFSNVNGDDLIQVCNTKKEADKLIKILEGENTNIKKECIASDLRIAIEYYTELTVNEHLTQTLNKDADKAWKKVDKLIKQLAEEA